MSGHCSGLPPFGIKECQAGMTDASFHLRDVMRLTAVPRSLGALTAPARSRERT